MFKEKRHWYNHLWDIQKIGHGIRRNVVNANRAGLAYWNFFAWNVKQQSLSLAQRGGFDFRNFSVRIFADVCAFCHQGRDAKCRIVSKPIVHVLWFIICCFLRVISLFLDCLLTRRARSTAFENSVIDDSSIQLLLQTLAWLPWLGDASSYIFLNISAKRSLRCWQRHL